MQDNDGNWQSRAIPETLADYAGYLASHLSDRVKHFFTIYELRPDRFGQLRVDQLLRSYSCPNNPQPGHQQDLDQLDQTGIMEARPKVTHSAGREPILGPSRSPG